MGSNVRLLTQLVLDSDAPRGILAVESFVPMAYGWPRDQPLRGRCPTDGNGSRIRSQRALNGLRKESSMFTISRKEGAMTEPY